MRCFSKLYLSKCTFPPYNFLRYSFKATTTSTLAKLIKIQKDSRFTAGDSQPARPWVDEKHCYETV